MTAPFSIPLLRAWRSLLSLALVVAGLSASPALAAGEVSLLSAFSAVSHKYGFTWQDASFTVVVRNLAYDKQVAIHVNNQDGTWVDLPAQYVGPADDGREVWRASTQYSSSNNVAPRDLEFVAMYTVNGQTYWDNNNGQNYFLGQNEGTLLHGTNVLAANSYLSSDGYFTVSVDVQNLAYDKQVKIVYTPDNWATVREAFASYSYGYTYAYAYVPSPNANGVERWTLSLPNTGAQNIQFAVAYTVNGQTSWDNNFGHNYSASPQ
jgi:hypothetical protein